MFLCKYLFWDRYLLDPDQNLLERVNEWTHIAAVSARCKYSAFGEKKTWFVYSMGRDWSKPVSFYEWKPYPYSWVHNLWYWSDSSEETATDGDSWFGMKAQIKCTPQFLHLLTAQAIALLRLIRGETTHSLQLPTP